MIIKLYNIPGISPDNEPYFSSVSVRETNFNTRLVKSLSTYFYPVQSENRIKFEVTDVPLTLVYNYISIEMYGKEWYYFVDSFRYVNEKIYYVNLFMDAIQTFYFDISFIKYEGKRSLNFTGLRDNLSLDPTLYPHSNVNYDENKPFIFVVQYKERSVQQLELLDPYTSQNVNYTIEDIEENVIKMPGKYNGANLYTSDGLKTLYLLPNNIQTSYWRYFPDLNITDELLYANNRDDFMKTIAIILNDPNVVNAYVTKVYPKGINYGEHTVDNTIFEGFYLDENMVLYKNGMIHPSKDIKSPKTSLIEVVPQKYGSFTTPTRNICDSNYVQISIGEVNDMAIVPIELLEPNTSYDLYCMLDICSGVRTYWVDAKPLLDIKFRQVCNSIETLQLFNDKYNKYLLQNKGSLTTGIALQKTQAWVNFGNQILNQNAAKAFSGAMQGGVAGGIVAGAESTVTSVVDMFNTMYGIDKSIQAQRENAYYTPDTIKLGNNYTNDLFNGFLDRVVIETRVADYQDIVELRNYIGYLSNDVATDKTLLTLLNDYNWVNGKKLLMGSATLNLASFNTRDNLVAIKDRFEKGVRFYTDMSNLGK